jgi:hypothetical protein
MCLVWHIIHAPKKVLRAVYKVLSNEELYNNREYCHLTAGKFE